MIRKRFVFFLTALGLGLSAVASAQEAFTTRQTNVRAGPERDYPLVARLASGTPVNIVGCIEGYSWCDVVAYDIRGWVSARSLQYAYQGRRVAVYDYGPTIGLPLIGFTFGYWDSYYRNRPFYRDRPRWERRYNDRPNFVPQHNDRPQYRDRDNRPDRPQYRDRDNRPDRPQYQRPAPQPPTVRQPLPQVQPPHVERPRPQASQPQVSPPQVQRPRPEAPRQQPNASAFPGGRSPVDRPPPQQPGGN
ncbi:MAG: SH3 domain-containing protein [Betaproteobacteria bacterium]